MDPNMTRDNLLSTTQVAEILHVSVVTVNKYILKGRFPGAYKLDPESKSMWLIPQTDVDAFLELQKQSQIKPA